MNEKATLHIFCGKMASGKSTLAKKIAEKRDAILIVEDDWLLQLYPVEISDISSYVEYSARLRKVLSNHLQSLLNLGISVVFDFPANTIEQRNWLRSIYEETNSLHQLHYVDASDELCKKQLAKRSEKLPKEAAFTTDTEFETINNYFQAPTEDEGFNTINYPKQNI